MSNSKVFVLTLMGLAALFVIHFFLGLVELPKEPEGMAVYRDSIQADTLMIIVHLPVSCKYQKPAGTTMLECNCEERIGLNRVSHSMTAELNGKWCESAEQVCRALCQRPESLSQSYIKIKN